MKNHFSAEALTIWSQITGSKGFLSSNRTQGLAALLFREIKLAPVMIQYGNEIEEPDWTKFLAWRNRDFPDGHCKIYYHPLDLEAATGSKGHNWLQWAAKLLAYGRKTHPLAPRMKPVGGVALSMRAAGKKVTITRFLTLELVIFYLAAQTRTWGKHHRIIEVKDLIAKNDVATMKFLPPTAEAINVHDLMAVGDPTPELPKTRVPKAGLSLVAYNPAANKPAARQIKNTILKGVSADPNYPETVDTSVMSNDELAEHIQTLQNDLNERRALAREREFAEKASQAILLHDISEIWHDKPEYATITVLYGDGSKVKYYHDQLLSLQMGLEGEKLDEDLDVSDLLQD